MFGWMERWRIALFFFFCGNNNLTHIVSGILQLLVLDSWRDCAHTDRDKSLSTMRELVVSVAYNRRGTFEPFRSRVYRPCERDRQGMRPVKRVFSVKQVLC